eukprot:maker-scaffold82_size396747-snap-gene-2.30 protein:Tk06840 transcript:maker-scaffold82_size396747-snap-gene-2.30-mRNA-1 annotation:"glutathione s-transferase mu2"
MSSGKVILGYWDCRGLVEAIRLVLEFKSIPYEFRAAQNGPAPSFAKADWMASKAQILSGFDFPNLPYYQDDQVKLTHSQAILQYLGRKHDLVPTNEPAQIHLDLVREQLVELGASICNYVYFPTHRSQPMLDLFEKKKAKIDGQWLTGDQLTYVDFFGFELLDHIRRLIPGGLDSRPNLANFVSSFEGLPKIQSYHESARFQAYPLWSVRSFVGKAEGDFQ